MHPIGARPRAQGPPAGERSLFGVRQLARRAAAFTLLELLAVIAIIGIITAIALPTLNNFKTDTMAAASRQFLDDVARARQLAISQRTTVFMVFVPSQFWTDPNYGQNWRPEDHREATNLFGKQLIGYNFVAMRSMGDQPGQSNPRYLAKWRTMPEGSFISPQKFVTTIQGGLKVGRQYAPPTIRNPATEERFDIYSFNYTNGIPFPLEDTPSANPALRAYVTLPYIAFNYVGQLVDGWGQLVRTNEIVPLGLGSVGGVNPQTGQPTPAAVTESPRGNVTNSFTLVSVEWLTGRARIQRQEVQ